MNMENPQVPAQPQLPTPQLLTQSPAHSWTGAQKQNGWPKMIAISLSILMVFLVLGLIILALVGAHYDSNSKELTLIRSEIDELKNLIKFYNGAHYNSNSKELTLIRSEIDELKNLIKFYNGDFEEVRIENGTAKWDSDEGVSGMAEDAFSTKYESYACTGYGCGGSASSCSSCSSWPISIWYKFPSAHVPARFSFRHVSAMEGPKTWKFVGSKDEGCSKASPWVELCGDMVGDKEIVVGEEVGCEVPKYQREPFKCLGIQVYSHNDSNCVLNGSCNKCVCLKAMRFWEIA